MVTIYIGNYYIVFKIECTISLKTQIAELGATVNTHNLLELEMLELKL